MDWLERTDWSRRSAELGELSLHGERVQMECLAPLPARAWDLWLSLRGYPANILLADAPRSLRYAALDWSFEPLAFEHDGRLISRVATWGIVLARVYEFLIRQIGVDELAWLSTPFVKLDLEGVLRIGFRSAPDKLPPETMDQWPICNERALTYVIGRALSDLTIAPETDSHLGNILRRCLARDPAHRYTTLGELRIALQAAGGRMVTPAGMAARSIVWSYLEEGIGLLAADAPELAHARFVQALQNNPESRIARALEQEARSRGANTLFDEIPEAKRIGLPSWPPPPPPQRSALTWAEARSLGEDFEQQRDFAGALAAYRRVILDEQTDVCALELAAARCYFQLGGFASAIYVARLVLAREPLYTDALAIVVNALLREKRHAEALQASDTWVAASPDDAHAIYARGKCLLGLRRLHEARAAFDRACTLKPTMIEAMWLRTAVDRSLGQLSSNVGIVVPAAVDLPPGALRDALLEERIDDAITILLHRQRDAPLQLLLGDLLQRVGRTEESLAVYETVTDDAYRRTVVARRAGALAELGRADELAALFDERA